MRPASSASTCRPALARKKASAACASASSGSSSMARRAWAMAERMWDLGLAESPAGMLHYAMYPWVMSPARLTEAGFKCDRSSAETFAEVAGLYGDRVRLGHRAVRRSTLTMAAAGAGLLAAGAIEGARRRTSE